MFDPTIPYFVCKKCKQCVNTTQSETFVCDKCMANKTCKRCKQPNKTYSIDKRNADKLQNTCKDCRNTYAREKYYK